MNQNLMTESSKHAREPVELFHFEITPVKKRGKKKFNALVAIVIHLVEHDRRIINPLYQTQSKINQNKDGFNGSDKLVYQPLCLRDN